MMKALTSISRIQVRNETLILLLDLYESKGKTFYYNELFKKDMNAFVEKTLETDIINIIEMLKLDLTEARARLCAKKRFVPKDKDEQLIANIKEIISRTMKNVDAFEIIVNEIHELSKNLGNKHTVINWNKERINDQGLLASNKFRSKREDLEKLIQLFNSRKKEKSYETTNLITNFYVDFINMKIFDNSNDLIALFVLYVMVFQTFPIFKFVSFFKYYSKYQETWKYALDQANYNWASSFPQTDNLTEILYRILIESYEEVDNLAHQYEFEVGLNKSNSLENTILKFNRLFSKEDLREAHPTISDSTINKTLERLRDERKIMVIGAGRSSKWQVIAEKNDKFSQIEMFNE